MWEDLMNLLGFGDDMDDDFNNDDFDTDDADLAAEFPAWRTTARMIRLTTMSR